MKSGRYNNQNPTGKPARSSGSRLISTFEHIPEFAPWGWIETLRSYLMLKIIGGVMAEFFFCDLHSEYQNRIPIGIHVNPWPLRFRAISERQSKYSGHILKHGS